jgi:hypothetical protein
MYQNQNYMSKNIEKWMDDGDSLLYRVTECIFGDGDERGFCSAAQRLGLVRKATSVASMNCSESVEDVYAEVIPGSGCHWDSSVEDPECVRLLTDKERDDALYTVHWPVVVKGLKHLVRSGGAEWEHDSGNLAYSIYVNPDDRSSLKLFITLKDRRKNENECPWDFEYYFASNGYWEKFPTTKLERRMYKAWKMLNQTKNPNFCSIM